MQLVVERPRWRHGRAGRMVASASSLVLVAVVAAVLVRSATDGHEAQRDLLISATAPGDGLSGRDSMKPGLNQELLTHARHTKVSVRVPSGLHVGDSFEFTSHGKVFTATVPDGYTSGEAIKVKIPAVASTIPAGFQAPVTPGLPMLTKPLRTGTAASGVEEKGEGQSGMWQGDEGEEEELWQSFNTHTIAQHQRKQQQAALQQEQRERDKERLEHQLKSLSSTLKFQLAKKHVLQALDAADDTTDSGTVLPQTTGDLSTQESESGYESEIDKAEALVRASERQEHNALENEEEEKSEQEADGHDPLLSASAAHDAHSLVSVSSQRPRFDRGKSVRKSVVEPMVPSHHPHAATGAKISTHISRLQRQAAQKVKLEAEVKTLETKLKHTQEREAEELQVQQLQHTLQIKEDVAAEKVKAEQEAKEVEHQEHQERQRSRLQRQRLLHQQEIHDKKKQDKEKKEHKQEAREKARLAHEVEALQHQLALKELNAANKQVEAQQYATHSIGDSALVNAHDTNNEHTDKEQAFGGETAAKEAVDEHSGPAAGGSGADMYGMQAYRQKQQRAAASGEGMRAQAHVTGTSAAFTGGVAADAASPAAATPSSSEARVDKGDVLDNSKRQDKATIDRLEASIKDKEIALLKQQVKNLKSGFTRPLDTTSNQHKATVHVNEEHAKEGSSDRSVEAGSEGMTPEYNKFSQNVDDVTAAAAAKAKQAVAWAAQQAAKQEEKLEVLQKQARAAKTAAHALEVEAIKEAAALSKTQREKKLNMSVEAVVGAANSLTHSNAPTSLPSIVLHAPGESGEDATGEGATGEGATHFMSTADKEAVEIKQLKAQLAEKKKRAQEALEIKEQQAKHEQEKAKQKQMAAEALEINQLKAQIAAKQLANQEAAEKAKQAAAAKKAQALAAAKAEKTKREKLAHEAKEIQDLKVEVAEKKTLDAEAKEIKELKAQLGGPSTVGVTVATPSAVMHATPSHLQHESPAPTPALLPYATHTPSLNSQAETEAEEQDEQALKAAEARALLHAHTLPPAPEVKKVAVVKAEVKESRSSKRLSVKEYSKRDPSLSDDMTHDTRHMIHKRDPSLSDLEDFLNPTKTASVAAKIAAEDPSAPHQLSSATQESSITGGDDRSSTSLNDILSGADSASKGIAGDGSIADVLATYMQGPSSSDRESEDILKTQAELANFQPDGPIPDDVPHDDVEAGDMTHSRSGHDIAHSSAATEGGTRRETGWSSSSDLLGASPAASAAGGSTQGGGGLTSSERAALLKIETKDGISSGIRITSNGDKTRQFDHFLSHFQHIGTQANNAMEAMHKHRRQEKSAAAAVKKIQAEEDKQEASSDSALLTITSILGKYNGMGLLDDPKIKKGLNIAS